MDLSKFKHGFVKVVTCYLYFWLFAKKNKLKFDEDIKAC